MAYTIPDSAQLLHICYGSQKFSTPLAEANERMKQVRAGGWGHAFLRPIYKIRGHYTCHSHPELDVHHYEVYGMPNKPKSTDFCIEKPRKKKQEWDTEPTEEDLKQLEQEPI